jgi:hypothetical protein
MNIQRMAEESQIQARIAKLEAELMALRNMQSLHFHNRYYQGGLSQGLNQQPQWDFTTSEPLKFSSR